MLVSSKQKKPMLDFVIPKPNKHLIGVRVRVRVRGKGKGVGMGYS